MKPYDFVLESKGVTSFHVAKCSGSIVKMWHTALDTDEEAAITLIVTQHPQSLRDLYLLKQKDFQ